MNKVIIQQIRNATLKITYADNIFLVDPVLGEKHSFTSFVDPSKNLNPTVDLPFSIKEITQDVDAVIITHTHPDHFDAKAIQVLEKNLPVIAPPADVKIIKNAGFQNTIEINDSYILDGIELTKTGGKHGPAKDLELLGEVSGFVLKKENYPSLYIVGDCIWDKEVENNLKKHQPDIVITNSGGAVFMGKSKILMDDTETIKLAKATPDSKIIAVHMEALDHCRTTRADLTAAAKKANRNILIPLDGESIEL